MFKYYRSSRPNDTSAPYSIYSEGMASLGQGYALWYPEPNVTGQPHIGDVGYIKEGSFIRLFNINDATPDSHKVTYWGSNFEISPPVPPDVFRIDRRHNALRPGVFVSHGVQERETGGSISVGLEDFFLTRASASATTRFSCTDSQGAVLEIKSPATSETIFDNEELKRYMVLQHEHWYSYARNELRLGVEPEQIVLVSGCGKTTPDWANVVFSNTKSSSHVAVQGHATRFATLDFFRSRAKALSRPKAYRRGESYLDRDSVHERDQCIFVRRYRLLRRLKIVHEIVAGAEYYDLKRHPYGEWKTVVVAGSDLIEDENASSPTPRKTADPVDTLLEYILEVCGAECAIARDEDIESIVGGNPWPVDFATFLRKVQPPVQLSDGYASVSIPDLFVRERAAVERRHVSSHDLRQWPMLDYEGRGVFKDVEARFPWSSQPGRSDAAKWTYLEFNDAVRQTPHKSALSYDGTLLAVAWLSGGITLWRTADGLLIQRLEEPLLPAIGPGIANVPRNGVTALAFSPFNNTSLLVGTAGGGVGVLNIRSGEIILRLGWHTAQVDIATYAPDGSRMLTLAKDATIKVWDTATGALMHSVDFDSEGGADNLVFSADGSRFAVRTPTQVIAFNVDNDRLRRTISIPSRRTILDVNLSPDGEQLVIADNSNVAHVFGTETGQRPFELQGYSDRVCCCAFSPDGDEIATGSDDGTIVYYNSQTGAPRRSERHGTRILALSYSPGGTFLAGVTRQGIFVWNPTSRQHIATFPAKPDYLSGVRWLADEWRMLSYGEQGPLCLWSVGDVLRVRAA